MTPATAPPTPPPCLRDTPVNRQRRASRTAQPRKDGRRGWRWSLSGPILPPPRRHTTCPRSRRSASTLADPLTPTGTSAAIPPQGNTGTQRWVACGHHFPLLPPPPQPAHRPSRAREGGVVNQTQQRAAAARLAPRKGGAVGVLGGAPPPSPPNPSTPNAKPQAQTRYQQWNRAGRGALHAASGAAAVGEGGGYSGGTDHPCTIMAHLDAKAVAAHGLPGERAAAVMVMPPPSTHPHPLHKKLHAAASGGGRERSGHAKIAHPRHVPPRGRKWWECGLEWGGEGGGRQLPGLA